jgi:hypothetical protein
VEYPSRLGPFTITRATDLTPGHGFDSLNEGGKPDLPLSDGEMVQFRGEGQGGMEMSLTIRTSGTEPKVSLAHR